MTVHPKWVEEVNSEVRTKLCTAMCSAEHLAKRYHKPAAFSFLKRCHKNAWDASILREIFSNKLSSTTGKFINYSIANNNGQSMDRNNLLLFGVYTGGLHQQQAK